MLGVRAILRTISAILVKRLGAALLGGMLGISSRVHSLDVLPVSMRGVVG